MGSMGSPGKQPAQVGIPALYKVGDFVLKGGIPSPADCTPLRKKPSQGDVITFELESQLSVVRDWGAQRGNLGHDQYLD